MDTMASSAASFATEETLTFDNLERVDAPCLSDFRRLYQHQRRPVVVRGLTKGWLPLSEWTPQRMAARYGQTKVVAASLLEGRLLNQPQTGLAFRYVELETFVASLGEGTTSYVMAPLHNFPEQIHSCFRVPKYCEGAAHLRVKVWLGAKGTVTALHRDVPHNLHFQMSGRKRWILFPPRASRSLYPFRPWSPTPNFAHMDPEAPDFSRHPRARTARGTVAVLDPGEALFVPSGWWHHARCLENSVSINFWWGGPIVRLTALSSSLFKRARRISRYEWG